MLITIENIIEDCPNNPGYAVLWTWNNPIKKTYAACAVEKTFTS